MTERDLPLRDAFTINGTPGARQVVVHAPRSCSLVRPRRHGPADQGRDETLRNVQITLQLPQGWTAQPLGQTSFGHLAPDRPPSSSSG